MQYTAANLLLSPGVVPDDPDLILSISPETAGWEYISFQARRLAAGASWSFQTGENELALVNLSGRYAVRVQPRRLVGNRRTQGRVPKRRLTHSICRVAPNSPSRPRRAANSP